MDNILRVGTFNIHHGSIYGRYVKDIGKLLQDNNLDIIGIQEIDIFCNRSDNINVLEEVAKAGNYQYYQFYKTMNWQNGEYGLGIISKYPIIKNSITKLTPCDEPRILVNAEIDINGKIINFLVTHFDLGTYEDIRLYHFNQTKEIIQKLQSFILTGDFNVQDWRVNGNINEFENHFKEYNIINNPNNVFLTYSGKEIVGEGLTPIDNIITSSNIQVINSEMIDTDLSDHDLLLTEVKFNV